MFHKLLFLGPGGRTVYQGSVEGAKEYFDGMEYPCPANINPADHYMDVISGIVKKGDEKSDPSALFDAWINHAAKKEINEIGGELVEERIGSLEIILVPGTNFIDLLGGAQRAILS